MFMSEIEKLLKWQIPAAGSEAGRAGEGRKARGMRSIWITVAAALIGWASPSLAQGPARDLASPSVEPAPAAADPAGAGRPAPASRLTRGDLEAWLDGFMPYALKRGDIAGAVVVVVKDGGVLLQKGYGYADTSAQKPVAPAGTLFRMGSVSKLFTWTAVMQLVEQGRLELDRDVNAYLDFTIPPRDGKPVTLRSIMTHTAGFEETFRGLIGDGPGAVPPLSRAVSRWTPERIFAPGTTPAYSNYATGLAGYIVERVSGVPFDQYVEREIFQPLQMRRSSFRQPLPAELRPLMSNGYARGSGNPMPYEMIALAPAGAAAATGADIARFMIAHLDDGRGILRPETARLMHDTRLDMIRPLNRMALGFYEQDIGGRNVIGHGGDTQWFHSHLWLFPQADVGLFVAMNSSGRDGAAGAIRRSLFEQFAERHLAAARPKPRPGVDPKLAAQHARLVAGTYVSSRRPESSFFKFLELVSQLKVGLVGDGGLNIGARPGIDGAPRKWVETEPFVWREIGGHSTLAADVVDGRVVRLAFSENSPFTMFEPAPWYRSSAWLLPAFVAGLVVLALTALSWPVGAAARRRYGVPRLLTGRDLAAYRFVRGGAGLVAVHLVGWGATMAAMLSNFKLMNGGLDWLVRLLQIGSFVAFPAMLGIAGWHVVRTWRGSRNRLARIWSVLILLAALAVLWVAVGFNLLVPSLDY